MLTKIIDRQPSVYAPSQASLASPLSMRLGNGSFLAICTEQVPLNPARFACDLFRKLGFSGYFGFSLGVSGVAQGFAVIVAMAAVFVKGGGECR
jgi:hypothetical protein